jgi:hypothetical protein
LTATSSNLADNFRSTAGTFVCKSTNPGSAPRPDTTIVYTGGFRAEQTRRLETITVRLGAQLVTRYDLVYTDEDASVSDPLNGASLLFRVVRFGANDTSQLPADTFTYSEPLFLLDAERRDHDPAGG